ncbi:Protein LOW PSII ACCUMULATION 2- chloroplastic [Striga hermonthica]|uniref:Protein LOW PSII ACCUMULATION 2- chloroplastic n=1 Tax=Striga hermonthica TaxID=68872 RepID=A0A9N7R3L5_STRHE|nr:Protein LOW PSII ACCUMULATION 2- chloroplastic [Striga hermonthica]
MALIVHPSSSSPSLTTVKPHLRLHRTSPKFLIRAQNDLSTEEPKSGAGPSAKKPGGSSPGLGFGSPAAASSPAPAKTKQSKGKRERASIIRREPVEKPNFATPQPAAQAEELRKNESYFLFAWLGLGAVILLEGIALAASGFLPEAWDNFFVKYLYPAFTPTVFLFVAGTVAYGVLKYLQNENSNNEN